jgi:hypothetical protein
LAFSKFFKIYSLTNLERLKIRDPSSTSAIKNYVEGAEIITPQPRKIIDEQKKLIQTFVFVVLSITFVLDNHLHLSLNNK